MNSENLDLQQMNRILRHRLRNLCAGVKMTVSRISDTVAETHPRIPSRCDIIISELDNLQQFTDRMNLLFDPLPQVEDKEFYEIITELQENFSSQFPLISLSMSGKEYPYLIKNGSWIIIALTEILKNAAEAIGSEECVTFSWRQEGDLIFRIKNEGSNIPKEIPCTPPKPFFTTKSRHDGLGLAITQRICNEIEALMRIDNIKKDVVVIELIIPQELVIHE
jgi:signal transduction histidine kinase